jgi:hypothetical protein
MSGNGDLSSDGAFILREQSDRYGEAAEEHKSTE